MIIVRYIRTSILKRMPRYNIFAWALTVICCTLISAVPTTALAKEAVGHSGSSHCKNLTFTVQATALNKVIPSPVASTLSTQDGVNAFYASLPKLLAASTNQTRSGTYELAAVYCRPTQHTKHRGSSDRNTPLQILLHGSTYTKEYWDRGSWATAIQNIRGRKP